MAGDTEAMEGEQTLAHLLEFLARLQEQTEIRDKVIKEITEKVKGYVKDDGKFATEDATSGYLYQTISKCKGLRKNTVKTDGTYKHYTSQFQYSEDNKYSQHLINNVFALFGCLYYMYYECDTGCSGIKGGDWWQEKCNETSHKDKKHLNQWLQDKTGGTGRMIKRGFKDIPLSQMTGTNLFPKSQSESEPLLDFSNGAQLQFALFFMLFLPSPGHWNDAQSGYAVLFLNAFCEKVNKGEFFNGQYSDTGEAFKNTCQTLEQSIQKLMSSNTIVPVAWSPKVNYGSLLEATHFWEYIRWLKNNMQALLSSLGEMLSDVDKWNKKDLKESKTFGPFPWGFVFKYNGESDKEKLKVPLQELIKSLQTLQSALEKIKAIPPSSTASTVGGVAAGLGAAGAAGAAAAYSGLLGPVAEGVGRFFKGLFI